MEIRGLKERDAGALWQLRLVALETEPAAFFETAEQHRTTPLAVYEQRLRTGPPDRIVFGAFEGERLVGMAGLGRHDRDPERRAWIWGMFVLPEYRGKGAGRRLLQAALDHATTLAGLEAIELAVDPAHQAARHLYVSCGFESSRAAAGDHEAMILKLERGNAE